MIRKLNSPIPGHVRVVFELPPSTWADRIFLAGDFNGWDESAVPLRQEHDGVWRAMLDLPAGTHSQFRYLIDGQWSTDYHADGWVSSAPGLDSSIVHAVLPQVAAGERPAPSTKPQHRPLSPTRRRKRRSNELRAAA